MTKSIFIVLFIIGLIGSILFFPLPIDQRSTCIADHHTAYGRLSDSDTSPHSPGSAPMRNRHRLQRYLDSWAFLWWTSLLITGISTWKLFKPISDTEKKHQY
ncbi:MAG: hypothetical protein U5R06_16645 [candidate division KSB1 bacterium]|nr:hypothetical protein [candidate division KSB1 bacterium]